MSRFKLNPGQRRVLAQRTAADRQELRLWRSLVPLISVNSFLQTGAHPDDESSALLARLALGDGAHVAYVCAVRGEGGQSELGAETGTLLGVLRSAEMQLAARTLGIDLYWLNTELDGPVRDFRFSKSPEETLARWGAELLAERLVRAIRTHRPDAIMPTYLDVPGQHGHHRAVTRATIAAFRQAGDPQAFPQHAGEGLMPWQPAKLYLPAWSGASQSYDDTEQPPPATLTLEVGARDRVLGASYAQIGEWSRVEHLSQGMGVWLKAGPRAAPLHRLDCALPSPPAVEQSLFDGLPRTLGDLAERADAAIARYLRVAQAAIDEAVASYPSRRKIAPAVHAAVAALRRARAALPRQRDAGEAADLGHRIAVKLDQLGRASREAVGLVVHCTPDGEELAPGGSVSVSLSVKAKLHAAKGLRAALRPGDGLSATRGRRGAFTVAARPDAALGHPYRFADTLGAPDQALHAVIRYAVNGVRVEVTEDAAPALAVVPAIALDPQPGEVAWNLAAPRQPFAVTMAQTGSAPGHRLAFVVPPGWSMAMNPAAAAQSKIPAIGFAVLPPADLGSAAILQPTDNGQPALRLTRIAHPHIGARRLLTPAKVTVQPMRVALPKVRVGYVDGGADRAWLRLRQIGLEVELLDRATLLRGDLDRFDTIVVGVFAYRTRPELAQADARIQAWMRAGGNLLTLYHRPWDNWRGRAPYSLDIGQPSLRWRVTDENSAVTHLAPDHPLLNAPNPIGPADWQGWVKERGLYFASAWAAPYQALVAMADPDEAPLHGGLLSAPVGKGRHTHTSLSLHHQLDALVPGAYRLFANLVAPARL
jgi:LmbE family N-acetylglucosaminyl deacetylase